VRAEEPEHHEAKIAVAAIATLNQVSNLAIGHPRVNLAGA